MFRLIWELIKNNLDLIATELAKLFDRFKMNNPLVAGAIIAVLIGVQYFLIENCMFSFCETEWLAEFVNFLSLFLLGVIGSRTSKRLAEHREKKGENLLPKTAEKK